MDVSLEEVNRQLDNFRKGFPYLRLAEPATVNNGIVKLADFIFYDDLINKMADQGETLKQLN